jgi:creatinine amidohydrolase
MNHFPPTATTSDEEARGAESAILPVGSFEQHGDYLPLVTDTVVASVIARELETSILLHTNPELVRDGYQAADWIADDRRHLLTTGMSEYTKNGVIGRPSLASGLPVFRVRWSHVTRWSRPTCWHDP